MIETSARLLRLLALLQARRFWTGAELAERLEVTERTVRRDVDRLRSLGYPVDSSAGVAGGYQLGAGATLPPLLLDEDEAIAVALSLRTAAAGTVSGVEEMALAALAKLERVLPSRLRRRVVAMRSAVVPMYLTGRRVDASVLTTLASACRDHLTAAFRYTDRAGSVTKRVTEPHGLVHTGTHWYLLAWDLDRADWRTFRVDRVAGEPRLGAGFTPRQTPDDVASYVSRSIAAAPYPHQARVVFHAPYERVAERVSPRTGVLRRRSKNRCVLEAGATSLETLAVFIAAVGEEFEVEGPPELVDVVAALAGRLSRAAARSQRG